jgi:hypothetical protein
MNCVMMWTQLKCSEAVRAQNGDQWEAPLTTLMLLG